MSPSGIASRACRGMGGSVGRGGCFSLPPRWFVGVQCVEHGFYPRYLVRAKQVGASQSRQAGEKRFRAPDFLPKKLKCVGQGVADGKTERTQSERVEKSVHLVSDPGGAVCQVSIIKPQPRVEDQFVDAESVRSLAFPCKILIQGPDRVGRKFEVLDGPRCFPLDIAQNNACTGLSRHRIDFLDLCQSCQV